MLRLANVQLEIDTLSAATDDDDRSGGRANHFRPRPYTASDPLPPRNHPLGRARRCFDDSIKMAIEYRLRK